MLLIKAMNISKTYGTRQLFSIDRLEIREHDIIGLIGTNGAGKSTLLNILYGSESPDTGSIYRWGSMGIIRQLGKPAGEANGQYSSLFHLQDSPQPSGGENTRTSIAAALSQRTNILFADEPTTNLDFHGIKTLKTMLAGFKGALVLVSHDRKLLDEFCHTIWELEEGKLHIFSGAYSQWVQHKEQERNFAQQAYQQYLAEKKRLTEAIQKTRLEAKGMHKPPKRMSSSEWLLHKNKAAQKQGQVQKQAKALETRLKQLIPPLKPIVMPDIRMSLGSATPITAKIAAQIQNFTLCYGQKTILENVSFTIPTGKCTVMLGPNGSGKTSLLKELRNRGPSVTLAPNAMIGYFQQNQHNLHDTKTILENVQMFSHRSESDIRTILAQLNIRGNDIHKKTQILSGGERAKVMFAQLLASNANFFLMDEPTNHIDLYTMQALEKLLQSWQGTILLVTHDQYLAEKLAEHLIWVEHGKVTSFAGTWEQYQRHKKKQHQHSLSTRGLDKTILQMRIATLCSRLEALKKTDNRQELEKELTHLVNSLQQLR